MKVGDRVFRKGFGNEPDRHGTVTKRYSGQPSAIGNGVPMLEIQWDDGQTEDGYIEQAAQQESLKMPTWRYGKDNGKEENKSQPVTKKTPR